MGMIDDRTDEPLPLRVVTLAGPLIGRGERARHLWALSAAAPYFGARYALDAAGNRIGVTADHVHPLRVLTVDAPDKDNWHRPRLFDIHLIVGATGKHYQKALREPDEPEVDHNLLSLGWDTDDYILGAEYGKVLRTFPEQQHGTAPTAPFVHVVADALPKDTNRWPEPPGDKHSLPIPPYSLVAGRIGLQVNRKKARAKWISDLKVGDPNDAVWATMWLVQDGIEFEAELPLPSKMQGLRGRVLLYASQGQKDEPEFKLRLLEAVAPDAWMAAWAAMTPQDKETAVLPGLRVTARRSGAVPAFEWTLQMKKGVPDRLADSVDIPAQDCELALVSPGEPGRIDGVATLRNARLSGKRAGTDVELLFESGTWVGNELELVANPGGSKLKFGTGLSLDPDLHRLAGDLRGAYGLSAPPPVPYKADTGQSLGAAYGRPLLPAFVALDDGWLQLPVPNLGPLDTESDQVLAAKTLAAGQPASVLNGFLRYQSTNMARGPESAESTVLAKPPATPPWQITIETAAAVKATLTIKPGAAAKLADARVQLKGVTIATRGLLWVSGDCPDAYEGLPRLGAGPGSFIDVAMATPAPPLIAPIHAGLRELTLSIPNPDDDPLLDWKDLTLSFNTGAQRWSEEVIKPAEALRELEAWKKCIVGLASPGSTVPWPAVAWLRHASMPLVATMPMTRAAGSPRPLESRDLMPFALFQPVPAPQDAPIPLARLVRNPVSPLLKLALDGSGLDLTGVARWPGKPVPLAERGIAFACVGLPGIELSGTRRTPQNQLLGAARFDLPLLDEAFATASLPPGTADGASADAPPIPVPSVLDWPILCDYWDEQERKHQNCRVAQSYMSDYTALGSSKHFVATTLLHGTTWNPELRIDEGEGPLPYGTLTLDQDTLSGNAALLGYTGHISAAGGESVDIVGYSPATYTSNGYELDNAGAGALPAEASGLLIKRPVNFDGAGPSAFLATLARPLEVEINGIGLQLWFKDVLFLDEILARLPASPGKNDFNGMFDAAALACQGMEWRFADAGPEGGATLLQGRSEIACEGFLLEPVHLQRVELEAGELSKIEIVCRLDLVAQAGASGAAGNLITLAISVPRTGGPAVANFLKADLRFVLQALDEKQEERRIVIAAELQAGKRLVLAGKSLDVDMGGVPFNAGIPQISSGPPVLSGTVIISVTNPSNQTGKPGEAWLRIKTVMITTSHDLADGSLKSLVPRLEWNRQVSIHPVGPEQKDDLPIVLWESRGDPCRLFGYLPSQAFADFKDDNSALIIQAGEISARPVC
ncbi:hypothetical protein UNDYM_5932 (plasmid) [Undibacterium sp. YM2]|uniref:hypothetical protein n=1 Tax=Undibacterium sp. YM2 TaxID=2058625 RepID=UPI001331C913|nr:hypothetical protein [Undibacterium sp. YM2]BBB70185.1 hypothetical protein UNDYM_5932 [Undibacterium sp. YM2]